MSTLTANTGRARTKSLPDPLCKPFPHFIRFTRNTLQTLISAGLLAYVGMLVIVALYYLLFETTPTMTNWWHSTVPNSDIRHTIRNVAEGLLGGVAAQAIIWSHYKPKVQKRLTAKKNLLDKIEIALHIPNVKDGKPFSLGQLLITPFLVLLYAIPGGVVGFLIVHWLHRHNLHALTSIVATNQPPLSAHEASIITTMKQTFTQAWPTKLVGYGAAFFFGRRPARGVFDDVQLLFAERRVSLGQKLHWWHPPTFKARYNDVAASNSYSLAMHSTAMKRIVVGMIPLMIGLAGFGWYVLAYIAKGK